MPLYEEHKGVESAVRAGTWATRRKEVGWIKGWKIVRPGREKYLESRFDRTGWLDDERLEENKKLITFPRLRDGALAEGFLSQFWTHFLRVKEPQVAGQEKEPGAEYFRYLPLPQ